MPAALTPPAGPPLPPIAADSLLPNEPSPPTDSSTTSLRRYGPPDAVRVVCALARFSAVTSIRRRSAVSAEAETSNASNRPMSAAHADRGLQDGDARLGDLHGR